MIKKSLDKNAKRSTENSKLKKLKEIFPNCFDKNDKLDILKLQEEVKNYSEISFEGYSMDFLGKNYAKFIGDTLETETIIVPDKEHNGENINKDSQNLYLTGDNLEVLKQLRKSYLNEVKVIYIDPPYNTGEDGFAYNDNFNFSKEDLERFLGVDTQEAERIFDMTSGKSSSHSAWLTFMYPRIFLARELLHEKGLIFISIDDIEVAQLKLLCDDLFGEANFIAQFIREKRTNRENRKMVSSRHDYVLCYGKNSQSISGLIKKLPMSEKALASYKNLDNDPNGLWKSDPATAQAGHGTRSQFYTLIAPNGKKHELPSGRCWAFNETAMKKEIDEGRIWFGKDGNGVPRIKTYFDKKERGLTPESIWFAEDIATNEIAKNQLKELFDNNAVFETPKPVSLIEVILQISTNENDIVLDFFAGSSSTAHGVLEHNMKTKKNLKFIMVQLNETIKEKSTAKNLNYNTIDEIGRERIQRAAKEIQKSYPSEAWKDADLGFKHFFVQELEEETLENIREFTEELLVEKTFSFDDSTIITTWANEDGYGLNPDIKLINLEGYKAYLIKESLYLLDENMTNANVSSLLKKFIEEKNFNPTRIVLYGYNFNDFNILMELETNLKQLRNEDKNIEVVLTKRY